jgi:hypothetical protein
VQIRHPVEGIVTEWTVSGYGFATFPEMDGPCFLHASGLVNGQPRRGDRVRIASAKRGVRGWRSTAPIEVLESD